MVLELRRVEVQEDRGERRCNGRPAGGPPEEGMSSAGAELMIRIIPFDFALCGQPGNTPRIYAPGWGDTCWRGALELEKGGPNKSPLRHRKSFFAVAGYH